MRPRGPRESARVRGCTSGSLTAITDGFDPRRRAKTRGVGDRHLRIECDVRILGRRLSRRGRLRSDPYGRRGCYGRRMNGCGSHPESNRDGARTPGRDNRPTATRRPDVVTRSPHGVYRLVGPAGRYEPRCMRTGLFSGSRVGRRAPRRASSRNRTDGLPVTKRVHGLHALEAESAHPDSNRDARGKSPVRCRYGHEPVAPAGFEPASVRLEGGRASDRATGHVRRSPAGHPIAPRGRILQSPQPESNRPSRRRRPGGDPSLGQGAADRRQIVWKAGLEPATPGVRSRCASNCATPRSDPVAESKNGRGESNPYLRLGRPSCCPLNTTPAGSSRIGEGVRAHRRGSTPGWIRTNGLPRIRRTLYRPSYGRRRGMPRPGGREGVSRAGLEPATPRISPASSTLLSYLDGVETVGFEPTFLSLQGWRLSN